jgi:hypothetical protein
MEEALCGGLPSWEKLLGRRQTMNYQTREKRDESL